MHIELLVYFFFSPPVFQIGSSALSRRMFLAGFYVTPALIWLSEFQAGVMLLLQLVLQSNLWLYLSNSSKSNVSSSTALFLMAASIVGVVFLQRRISSGLMLVTGRTVAAITMRLRRELLSAVGPRVVTAQTGLTAVVTGGNNGIGFETVRGLLIMGFDVYMLCRNEERARDAIKLLEPVTRRTGRSIHYIALDLADDVSIRRAALQILELAHIDVLINNAGMLDIAINCRTPPSKREKLLQVNFYGLVLFTELLLPKLMKPGCSSAGERYMPRIINLGSVASTWANIPTNRTVLTILRSSVDPSREMDVNTYGLTKLLVIQYTRHLASRLKGSGISVCSVHPGAVLTDIFQSLGFLARVMNVVCPILFKLPDEGSVPTLHCVASQSLISGAFYADCRVANGILNPRCFDRKEAEDVFDFVKETLKF